jgi:hypothetical protein
MAVREPASSKAIELKKQGFGVAAAKDEAAKRPSCRRQAIPAGASSYADGDRAPLSPSASSASSRDDGPNVGGRPAEAAAEGPVEVG